MLPRVPDWAGGTRIGEAVKTFNYTWARRTLGGGSVVLVISDGWDRASRNCCRGKCPDCSIVATASSG